MNRKARPTEENRLMSAPLEVEYPITPRIARTPMPRKFAASMSLCKPGCN